MPRAKSQEPRAKSQNSVLPLPYKITRLEINGQVLEYEDEIDSITYDNIGAINEEDARELFHKTKILFDEAGIKFSLVFGSLLGAVRDKGLIKGDEDMDIFVMDEDQLRSNLINFQREGLKVCRIFPGLLYSFRINSSCYIDVYIMCELRGWKSLPWRLYCVSLCGYETPRRFFSGWTEIDFLGEKVICPEKPERLLAFWYGSNWRIPVRGHKFIYRVKSAHYAHIALSYLKKIAKLLFSSTCRQKILQRKRETGSFFKK